jgi:hypothetical protein
VTLAVVQAVMRCRRLGESLRRGHGNCLKASGWQHELAAGVQVVEEVGL